MVQVGHLFLGEGGFRVQVAHVQCPLDVMLDSWTGVGDDSHGARDASPALGADTDARLSVDDELPSFGVVPHRGLERLQLLARQVVIGPLPYFRGLGYVGIAVEGGVILGHARKSLYRHCQPPTRVDVVVVSLFRLD